MLAAMRQTGESGVGKSRTPEVDESDSARRLEDDLECALQNSLIARGCNAPERA